MRGRVERSFSWSQAAIVVGLLLVLAIGVYYVNHALLPTIGILVIGVALVLPPRTTLIVAVVALVVAAIVAKVGNVEMSLVRLLNVGLACCLAVLASTFLDRRFRRIEQLVEQEAAVLDSVAEAVVVLDSAGMLVQGNASQARLVPSAVVGQPFHPRVGHVLADGSACPGGCPLDGVPPAEPSNVPVEGERITLDGKALPVAYTTGREVDAGLVVTIRDVSVRVQAEADRRVLLELAARQAEQDRMLAAMGSPRFTPPQQVPGLALDVWSTTDDPHSLTGADLVSASTLPDGRVLLLMVDVTGSGVAAARDAWKVMYACRAHMSAGAMFADMIAQCADTLTGDGDAPSASILGICLDLETGHLQAVSGGHPPPLLAHRNGAAEWVEADGRGFGDQELPGSYSLAEATLGSADSLVLYTDGVVDGDPDVITNLATLRSAAVALRAQPLDGLARRLLETARTSGVEGDATLVVVRLSPAS